MTKLKKVRYKTKTRTAGTFVLLSRLLIALFATPVLLAPPVHVLAQQSAQTGAQTQVMSEAIAIEDNAIRLFRVHVPQAALDDLCRRIAATRWSEQETVADQSQGVQLATMNEGTRPLLGNGVRLAESRGEAECLTAVRYEHRRTGHSLYLHPLQKS
jgi:hypothetical protein